MNLRISDLNNKPSRLLLSMVSIAFLITVVESCLTSNQNNCRKYRTGNFYLHSRYNGLDYYLKRSDSFQIETKKQTGLKSKWKIKWLNECEYNLKFVNEDRDSSNINSSSISLPDLNYKIISSSEKYYIYSCEINKQLNPIVDTIWLLNDKE